MRKETKNKILNVLFLISLIICLFLISNTYAKYAEQMDTSYNSSAKRWRIVVNNKIIREKTVLNEVIEKPRLTEKEDENEIKLFADDTIAPGREGYFDMEIDFSNVDVPFSVDFSVEQEASAVDYNNLPDFKYYGYLLKEKDIFYYNLPDTYKQLDFIESNGTQYIETNIQGAGADRVEIKKVHTPGDSPTYEVVPHNNNNQNIILFADYGTEGSNKDYKTEIIYGCKIYKDNVIVRELVPCYRVSDKEKGMYDMVTDRFFYNKGQNKFADTSTEIGKKCIIEPESTDFIDSKANVIAYMRWKEGNGSESSLEDELNNQEDTEWVTTKINNILNTEVKYNATAVFEQYIEN